MIDYKKEAAMIAALGVSDAARIAIQREVIALYRRGVAETWEEAAKVCDAINDKYEAGAITETDRWKDIAAETALECAAAIRTRKEGRDVA